MGSEGETSGDSTNSPVYVAVGRNVKEGKALLTWAAQNFEGTRNVCLVHVHQPTNLLALLNGKLSASKLKNHAIRACQEFERLKMQKLINQYLLFLSQMGIQADKVCIETSNIEEGILQLIDQYRIRRLIMEAASETFETKEFSDADSSTAMVVCQRAPLSCHIWFVSKGCLIYIRPVDSRPHLSCNSRLLSSTNNGGTTLAHDTKDNMDADAENGKYFEHPSESIEDVAGTTTPILPTEDQTSRDSSPLLLKLEFPEHLPRQLSIVSPDHEYLEKESCDLQGKLEHAIIDAENSRQRAFEESLSRWRAEEDALDAVHKAEAAESLCKEEINKCKEVEELLLKQKQEMEMMNAQHDQILKELVLIRNRKPELERQLTDALSSEKELEDKVIQAVNLLITFKKTRDKLRMEYDSAIRKINKYKALRQEDPLGIPHGHLFGISFSDIVEATQNFNFSEKIGEGRHGSVFRGTLSHFKVVIKMLPSSGSQSDSEFMNEVEVLSRVRHPNLVTLIGACPESRSLIYEYIENGSLEEHLSGHRKTRCLSCKTRIRIAIEICSTLLFLHANNTCNVHGNIKPSNILLDVNFGSKISDFGIHNLISWGENSFINDPEKLSYMDPETVENGDFTAQSDVYSFGVVLLRLLTARPAVSVVRDVKCAVERGKLDTILDMSAGDWPLGQAKQLANTALRCCEMDRLDRPALESEVWPVLEQMRELCFSAHSTSTSSCMDSANQAKVPSHFVCPIYKEVMVDPYIAGDGFTYEGDAIKGWFDSGHKTSPMTNLKLGNCDLLPNYALYYAIQEWQQNA